MTRPCCKFNIEFCPKVKKFKPEGTGDGCTEIVELKPEEAEALRLKHVRSMDQTAAAKRMKVSQSTFQRVLTSAHKKVSEALIEGRAIKILTKHQ